MVSPTFGSVLRTGLPTFLREGFVPLAGFYVGQRIGGLAVGIATSAAVSLIEYALARRAGREGLLVRLTLAIVLVQGVGGLLADSATVYLAAPLLTLTVWGAMFLGSAFTTRPLVGLLACAWYPFPVQYRHTDAFVRVFRVQTIVWGAMFLGRAAIRLAFLVGGADIGEYVAVAFFTGMPVTFAVVAWSIRHAINNLPPPSIGSSPAIASIVVFFQSNTVPPTSKNKACTSSITSA